MTAESQSTVLAVGCADHYSECLQGTLERLSYSMICVSDPDEGLVMLREHRFPVVVLHLTGLEDRSEAYFEQIKEIDKTTQIIVVAGQVPMKTLIRCLRLGACDLFDETTEPEEVAVSVGAALARVRRWMSMLKERAHVSTQKRGDA